MKPESKVSVFHIHEALNALQQNSQPRTMDELRAFIAEKFGPASQFFSCSLQDMSIDQAIEFMIQRQKINEVSANQFSINDGNQCNH